MIVYENTIQQFYKDVRSKRLVNFLCKEYETITGKPVSGELRYAWKYTLTILYAGLMQSESAVNPEAGIRIDLDESIQATHMKLVFASMGSGGFRYTLLGLYSGSGVKLTNADDIVTFREGDTRWTTLHPSMYMSSFARRMFRGIPQEELQSVNYESASWLFDCFYSPDTDILTDYDDQFTDEYPVFYANDFDELFQFLRPVLSSEGGSQALRKLSSIEKLSASIPSVERNEDQIYLISSITNNVRRNRKAWYIIEGPSGTGKDEIVSAVCETLRAEGFTVCVLEEGEEPKDRPDLVVINGESGFTPDQLEYANVSIYLYDGLRDPNLDSFEKDALLTSRAEETGAQLYISHLKQIVSYVDGGKGMRWLLNRLQLANIHREDYDPSVFDIRLVKSKKDFSSEKKEGLAFVMLPQDVIYDPATGVITCRKNLKKGIYKALSGGRRGALIQCENPQLRTYLEKELFALQQRQQLVRSYVNELMEGKKANEGKLENLAKNQAKTAMQMDSRYDQKLKSALGRGAWNKLSEQSRIWITTALMAYDNMRKYDRMVDFSGVCLQIGKACEYEIKKRFFTAYVEYMKNRYGEEHYLKKLPPECKTKPGTASSELLQENQITLGKTRYILGLDDSGKIVNRTIWEEFQNYATDELLADPSTPLGTIRKQLPVINKIKDDYRNRSAHSHAITMVDARECIEYVITVHRKLGELLDQYRS